MTVLETLIFYLLIIPKSIFVGLVTIKSKTMVLFPLILQLFGGIVNITQPDVITSSLNHAQSPPFYPSREF